MYISVCRTSCFYYNLRIYIYNSIITAKTRRCHTVFYKSYSITLIVSERASPREEVVKNIAIRRSRYTSTGNKANGRTDFPQYCAVFGCCHAVLLYFLSIHFYRNSRNYSRLFRYWLYVLLAVFKYLIHCFLLPGISKVIFERYSECWLWQWTVTIH
jgi:hypothetical protein